jgi:hypothetical protein
MVAAVAAALVRSDQPGGMLRIPARARGLDKCWRSRSRSLFSNDTSSLAVAASMRFRTLPAAFV